MRYVAVALLSGVLAVFVYAQTQRKPEGLEPYIPTRMDWLGTTLQASLRTEVIDMDGYLLQITSPDPNTVLIYVRYTANVNRAAMNITIDSARKVIDMRVKQYGWQDWVKVREDIQMASPH